jgi:hypothetical protein
MSVNLSNWREASHNRWSFINIDKILKVQTVHKADGDPSPLESNPVSFEDFKLQHGDEVPIESIG